LPQAGFSIVRSAGCSAMLISKDNYHAVLKLKSGWHLSLNLNCFAVSGQVSNSHHKYRILGKAGVSRALGFRPKVRGVAMILAIIRMVGAMVRNINL